MQNTPDPNVPRPLPCHPDGGWLLRPASGGTAGAAIFVATTNLVSTLIFLLSSAFALVAALAWNKAISDWLPTVRSFNLTIRSPRISPMRWW